MRKKRGWLEDYLAEADGLNGDEENEENEAKYAQVPQDFDFFKTIDPPSTTPEAESDYEYQQKKWFHSFEITLFPRHITIIMRYVILVLWIAFVLLFIWFIKNLVINRDPQEEYDLNVAGKKKKLQCNDWKKKSQNMDEFAH